MKITYDSEADAMLIIWDEKSESDGSDVYNSNFHILLDKNDKPVGVEILRVSEYVTSLNVKFSDITAAKIKEDK